MPDPSILRLIDANANRAREALRVLEDYARFVLDAANLTQSLKSLRHDFAACLACVQGQAIVHRDTPGDVGTDIKTPAEQSREDLRHVVVAAGKRLGEALRSLEEYVKVLGEPGAASGIESLRYRFYDIERRLALTLRPGLATRIQLCVLITQSICAADWLETARQALAGGADALQLREKNLLDAELLDRAASLSELCRGHGGLCIINDRPDIAVLSGADGVHVGQDDLPASQARRIVGDSKIVGVSTHKIEQARAAVLDGADYIGAGPIFKSLTKPRDFIAGPSYAAQIAAANLTIPALAIAGITLDNLAQVLRTGVRAVAVASAITNSPDVRRATQDFKRALATD